jgi:hypothetical protein
MKPGVDQMLIGAATALATRVLPQIDPANYASGDVKTIAVLLFLLAQETGRASGRLMAESAAMRGIFAQAAALSLPEDLSARIAAIVAEAGETATDLASLEAVHDRQMMLLIELHAAVEDSTEESARGVNSAIWALLTQYAAARALVLPPM